MEPGKTSLERAFELARSGACDSLFRLERQLLREGYYIAQIAGPVRGRCAQSSATLA